MVRDRSFKNYIASRFYNELFAAVSGFLEENRRAIGISSRTVGRIDNAELSDIEVKGIDNDDLPCM